MVRIILLSSIVILFSFAPQRPQRSRFHTVRIKWLRLEPKVIEIDYRDTVKWINESNTPQRVFAEDSSFKSPLLQKGESFQHVFKRVGYQKYYCEPRKKGTVRVILD